MTKYLLHIFISGIVAVASLMMAGCSDDALGDEPAAGGEPADGDMYLRFSMSMAESGIPGDSRAEGTGAGTADGGAAGVGETPGTSRENVVNTVDLLVFDVANDVLTNVIYLSGEQAQEISSANGVCVPIHAVKGQTVTVYAAVNMPEAIRDRYAGGAVGSDVAVSAVNSVNDYWTVIDEFVPGSGGKQSTLEASGNGGIPMTGVFRAGKDGSGSDELLIAELHASRDEAIDVAANVSRIVSKMHLLAELTDNGTPQYVKSFNSADAAPDNRDNPSNWIGWIHRENVRYMPNGTNRSTFLFAQPNAVGNLSAFKDPNMGLSGYIVDGKFNARLWSPDFVWHDGNTMQTELSRPGCRMATAEAYDAVKLDNTVAGLDDANRYTEGMYCLENYFDAPANELFFENYDEQMPAVTHMSIAAKMTPRVILVESSFVSDMETFLTAVHSNPDKTLSDYKLQPDDFTSDDETRWGEIKTKYFGAPSEVMGCLEITTDREEDATFLLDWSLKLRKVYLHDATDTEDGRFPSGTFYVYDQAYDAGTVSGQQYLCLTAGAVFLATGEHVVTIKSRSVPHIGGWGYYYTYIDGKGAIGRGVMPYTASQITRNYYYIITIENFGFPGGSKSDPEFIKVNTNSIGWDYRGKGNIVLH